MGRTWQVTFVCKTKCVDHYDWDGKWRLRYWLVFNPILSYGQLYSTQSDPQQLTTQHTNCYCFHDYIGPQLIENTSFLTTQTTEISMLKNEIPFFRIFLCRRLQFITEIEKINLSFPSRNSFIFFSIKLRLPPWLLKLSFLTTKGMYLCTYI